MEELIIILSENFTKIISIDEIQKHSSLYWGKNGVGDRFARKKFNYTSIFFNGKTKIYSENENDTIENNILKTFLEDHKNRKGIVGIFVHSKKSMNVPNRQVRNDIKKSVKINSCVCCGSNTDITCDHKNDLYNDKRVLNIKTQVVDDFQSLCNHCNLQKRQTNRWEIKNNKIYSAKNIISYKSYLFEFPWEKKSFDISDINTKKDTYWYDPVEFNNKIYLYSLYVIPILKEIKQRKYL